MRGSGAMFIFIDKLLGDESAGNKGGNKGDGGE